MMARAIWEKSVIVGFAVSGGAKRAANDVPVGLQEVSDAPLSSNICSIILTVHLFRGEAGFDVRRRTAKPDREPLERGGGAWARAADHGLVDRHRKRGSSAGTYRHPMRSSDRGLRRALLREDDARLRAAGGLHASRRHRRIHRPASKPLRAGSRGCRDRSRDGSSSSGLAMRRRCAGRSTRSCVAVLAPSSSSTLPVAMRCRPITALVWSLKRNGPPRP